MTDQPNPSQFKNFGAPPPGPSGMRHVTPWVKVLAGGGVAAAVTFYALQIALPDRLRPSSVAGDAAGDAMRHEIMAMKEEKIDMERRIADATAQANAKAQADMVAIQMAAQERTSSLDPVATMAGLTDVVCIGAQIVSSFTQPQGWSRSSNDDLYYAEQRTGAATCGMGNQIRQAVTYSQLDAIHQAAIDRGAPTYDGALRTVSAPVETLRPVQPADDVATTRSLPAVQSVNLHLTNILRGQLRTYSYGMPGVALDQMAAGLDLHKGYPDAWYNRVAAYQAAHGG